MTAPADSRIFAGSILAVDDLALSTITTGAMIRCSGFGSPSTEINGSTAASTIDEFDVGIPDSGEVTFEFFLDMDDAFQAEMETMRDNQEIREFTLTLPEGTINTLTFQGFVIDANVTGAFNDYFKMTLVLGIDGAIERSAVA